MLNMVMHVHGRRRPSGVLTGSSAKVPNADDYPPEGVTAVLHDLDSCFCSSLVSVYTLDII